MATNIYKDALLQTKIHLSPTELGSDLTNVLKCKIAYEVEGFVIKEGFVKVGSVHVNPTNYSAGKTYRDTIEFNVVYSCQLCNPLEGQLLEEITCTSISKAGIRGELQYLDDSPLIIMVPHDYNINNASTALKYGKIKEGLQFDAVVIGTRSELGDKQIQTMCMLKIDKPKKKVNAVEE